ncbi:MAG: hypothetical protein JO304_08785 [Solirubrobacterales bacterium]|nr:hypothetical protein [Solirubrobacterales bacterium]
MDVISLCHEGDQAGNPVAADVWFGGRVDVLARNHQRHYRLTAAIPASS